MNAVAFAWPLLLLLAAAGPEGAPELAVGGSEQVEWHAFAKSQVTAFRLQPGWVDTLTALEQLTNAARVEATADKNVPSVSAPPERGAMTLNTVRVWGRTELTEAIDLKVAWQVAWLLASDPAFVAGGSTGASLLGRAEQSPRRVADFERALAHGERYRVEHDLGELALTVHASGFDCALGRQVLSWGSGHLWNPTDLLSPFSPTEIDREVRRGVDALRLSYRLADTTQLELLWLVQRHVDLQGGVLRLQTNQVGFDVAPSMAKYGRDLVGGIDIIGDIGPITVHTEAAYTHALDAGDAATPTNFARAVAGVDWRPAESWLVSGEYYFNGMGAASSASYVSTLMSARARRGEVYGAGRHYLGLIINHRANELMSAQGLLLANLNDPSLLVVPTVEIWAAQSWLVRLAASLPVGEAPRPQAVAALTTNDVLTQSPAWQRESTSLGWQSEFGSASWSATAQLVGYF